MSVHLSPHQLQSPINPSNGQPDQDTDALLEAVRGRLDSLQRTELASPQEAVSPQGIPPTTTPTQGAIHGAGAVKASELINKLKKL